MKNVRKENIVQLLIGVSYDFEKKLSDFPLRYDIEALFEFECEHYVNKITENIVPLCSQYLDDYHEDSIDVFLKFINEKYQDTFIEDVNNCRKNDKNSILLINRRMIKEFSISILQHVSKTEAEKTCFMTNFLIDNEKLLVQLCKNNTEWFLYTIGQLANPKLQNTILNILHEDINKTCNKFLLSLDNSVFDKLILKYCCYPLDVTMEQYCQKWIAKDKIYIKFMKKMLGEKYEYSKILLKLAQKKSKNK